MDEDPRAQSLSEGGGERSNLSDFTPPRSSTVRAQLIQPPNDFRVSNSDAGTGVYSGAKYKLMSPGKLPISRSPCITIPPGLSPTSFLESPVLLSNIKPEPSPTTGSFFNTKLMPVSGGTSGFSFATNISNNNVDERKSTGFEFKFQVECNSASGVPSEGPAAISGFKGQESKLLDQVRNQCQSQSLGSASLVKCENAATSKDLRPDMFTSGASASVPVEVDTDELNHKGSAVPGVQVSESDHKDTGSSVITEKSSDDGYNWRKYGQKLVKGSEFPRSYYKCTYPNCEVKKIFERSHDGQITEIVYKGTHDHPKPQPSRRFNAGALMSIQQEQTDKVSCFTGQEDNTAINVQAYNMDPSGGLGMSPRQANDDSINGTASHLNNVNDDGDEDDPISKRRKLEAGCINVMPVVKPIREPRVVVQTMSEIDILDDGYRWRKYGQKVVRGNPNPRSYYKCTNAGCPVRKHVERASHDPKAVITTYGGKHNHDVPIGRTNSHDMAGPMVNGMPRIQSEENETVSLNLGVGINYDSDNRTYGPVDSEFVQNQNPVTSSNIKVAQASTVSLCYGVVNGGMNLYGSRENHVDTPPLRHSSDQYPQSHGRVLLGP